MAFRQTSEGERSDPTAELFLIVLGPVLNCSWICPQLLRNRRAPAAALRYPRLMAVEAGLLENKHELRGRHPLPRGKDLRNASGAQTTSLEILTFR